MAILGKSLLSIGAVGLLLGAPIADFDETHQFNPRWPPHAKFHNAQTITLSIILGILTLYYTWRRGANRKENLFSALICGSIYWAAGICAYFFPGTSGLDPEFGGPGFPQAKIFTGFWAFTVVGWAFERFLGL